MNSDIFEKYESEVRSYCRSFPTVFKKAKGSVLTDTEGKEYIDFFSGAGAVNYGHNNDEIKSALIEYLNSDGIIHALDMYTPVKADFIKYFEDNILSARGLDYKIQFPGPTGTNAVEAALKLARKVKGRSNIFALMGAFHGMTLGSLALTCDEASRGGAGVELSNVTHLPAPYMMGGFDTLRYARTLLDDDHSGVEKPAAFVLETVQADGGINVMSIEFLKGLREFCDENDILLIVDDIQVGCGRSGNFFSFERAGIKPDMVTVSKSIGGYGLPLSLVLISPELDKWSPGEHTGTFRSNQLSLVAARKALEVFVKEDIPAQVEHKQGIVSRFMKEEIETIDSRISSRGIGLVWGVDLSGLGGDSFSRKVMHSAFDNGLVIERVGRDNSVMKIMPPLVIEDELLIEGLRRLKNAIVKEIGNL